MRKWLIAVLSVLWLAWELISAFDGSKETWPLTQVIAMYVPGWLAIPAAALLAAWIVPHFVDAYRKRRSPPATEEVAMKGFQLEPVRWMTAILAVLLAVTSVSEFMDLLPEKVQAFLLLGTLVLSAILGRMAHQLVTPLARPRDDEGRRLVPVKEGSDPRIMG